MQARKSRADIPRFDVFECLSCNTTISESPRPPDDPSRRWRPAGRHFSGLSFSPWQAGAAGIRAAEFMTLFW